MAKQYDVLIRLLMIGDSGVGKTCMLCRFTEETVVNPHISTIGIDFKMKTLTVDGTRIRVQIWDTAGQERYETITTQYYRRAQGIILVYDITSETSFLNTRKWMHMVEEHASPDVLMVLVGNKNDADALRTVSRAEGERLAKECRMEFFESSAHESVNVNEVFQALIRQVIKQRRKSINRQLENIRLYGRDDSVPGESPESKASYCCT
ncbi:ras-related protein Rab-15-like isoform X2 [Anneissia japonica]|uniref:ras-related protein Rab-15-like isoform X1 n=1 Tax=Anneissia japonica TaxID=1529436 RepID=UPI0014259638|nr:ras-related protein Rab-15-like isoform X1 [Anneissia japonica]XP_033110583.1 ras-related protein Rab-15-like isoform X2 [Anneissia japonica]